MTHPPARDETHYTPPPPESPPKRRAITEQPPTVPLPAPPRSVESVPSNPSIQPAPPGAGHGVAALSTPDPNAHHAGAACPSGVSPATAHVAAARTGAALSGVRARARASAVGEHRIGTGKATEGRSTRRLEARHVGLEREEGSWAGAGADRAPCDRGWWVPGRRGPPWPREYRMVAGRRRHRAVRPGL